MWFFGKDKNKSKSAGVPAAPAPSTVGLTSKQIKTQALMAQMRVVRAEIGEENLQKLAEKLRLDDLKKKMRHDIDNDPKKRDRLLDELRYHVRDKE